MDQSATMSAVSAIGGTGGNPGKPAAGSVLHRMRPVEETMIMPGMLGYQHVRPGVSAHEVAAARRSLVAFAEVEGYCLAEVFVDENPLSPCSALVALINAARVRVGVQAVGVARAADLGPMASAQARVRGLIEREAGVRVLIVDGGGL